MKKHLLLLLVVLTLGLSGAAIAWFFTKRVEDNLERRVQAIESKKSLYLLGQKIEEIWSSGRYPSLDQLACPEFGGDKLDHNDRRFHQCNPDLLNCWLEFYDQRFGELIGNESSRYNAHKVSDKKIALKYGPRGRVVHFKLNDQLTAESLELELRDSCRDNFLPQGQYALGVLDHSKDDWLWDNLERRIYIDKFPVSNREVKEWLENAVFDEDQKKIVAGIETQSSLEWLMAAATKLRAEQQELFCAFQGRQLLTAHFFDAASFFPTETEYLKHLPRGPYPEGPRLKDSYLGLTLSNNDEVDVKKVCESFYAKECRKIQGPLYAHGEFATSWAGLFQVLGGHFEHLPNLVNPKKNLKLSSLHYSWSSSWHQLAERGYWSGKGHSVRDFNWRTQDPEDASSQYGVAFRCASLRSEEGE